MHTLATCRHELWRHSYARLLPPLPPGGVVVVGVLDGNSPLHDKDSFPPLHSLCKVKQFYCNRGGGGFPPLLGVTTTDCGTKFDLRSMWVLLNQRNRLRFSQYHFLSLFLFLSLQKGRGGLRRRIWYDGLGKEYFHEKWSGWKILSFFFLSLLKNEKERIVTLMCFCRCALFSFFFKKKRKGGGICDERISYLYPHQES